MQAHGDQDEVESLAELENAVGEARRALDRIESDAAEEQPDDGHHQALRHRGAAEIADHQEAEDQQGRVLGRAELQREAGQWRRQQHEPDHADRARDERADGGDGQRGARPSLARHLVAVETRHHRGRLAGNVEQDRRRRAAVHRAIEDAGEQDHRRRRRNAVGHGQ